MASPPYVSTQGGSFTLVDANGEQEPVETKHLDCVIFDVNMEVPVQRVYWDPNKPYNPNAQTYEPPDCWSDNGIGASASAAEATVAVVPDLSAEHLGIVANSKVTNKPVKACHVIKKVAVLPIMGAPGPDGTL